MIKRAYVQYIEWEDFKSGMWRKLPAEDEQAAIDRAIIFTGDYIKYGEAMERVIQEWPRTMLNSLSNVSINRKAFLGHCAAQYEIQSPEYITRMAWKFLTDKQREDANMQAELNIKKWEIEHENKNRKLHTGLGTQMLFPGYP